MSNFCTKDFEEMDSANDSWGEAFSEFEKEHPDQKIMECMDCGEWVALKSVTDDNYCPRCGGSLDGGEIDEDSGKIDELKQSLETAITYCLEQPNDLY